MNSLFYTLFSLCICLLLTSHPLSAQSCAGPGQQTDYDALKALYDANPNSSLNWDVSTCNVCTWSGVLCNASGRVILLKLGGQNLSVLPPQIGGLSELTSLDLLGNRLQELPSELGNLSNLIILNLSSNRLQSLPEELGNLSSLAKLELFDNFLQCLPEGMLALCGNAGLQVSLESNFFPDPFYSWNDFCDEQESICPTCSLELNCKSTYVVSLDDNGTVTFPASDLDDGSTGCGSLSLFVDWQSDVTLDCDDVGTQTLTLTVIDEEFNFGTCVVDVTVEDKNPDADSDGTGDPCDSAFDLDVKVDVMTGYIVDLGLSPGQTNSLLTQLQDAFGKYCNGKITPALNKLNAFINHVISLEADGVLATGAAQYLIDGAQAIIDAINNGELIEGCPEDGGETLAFPGAATDVLTGSLRLQVYPNPALDHVQVRWESPAAGPAVLQLLTLDGKVLETTPLGSAEGWNQHEQDLSELPGGTYLLRLTNGSGAVVKRLVKVAD